MPGLRYPGHLSGGEGFRKVHRSLTGITRVQYTMRALVAVPSIKDFYFTPHRASALGARAVMKVLSSLGWDAELIIFPLLKPRGSPLPLPKGLSHLSPYILEGEQGPTGFFRQYYRFGPSPEDAAKAVLAENPDLVLVSCFAWAYAEGARELINQIKTIAPNPPVILGGAGAAVLPEYFTAPENPGRPPDVILGGEVETQLRELLEGSPGVFSPGPHTETRVIPFNPDTALEEPPVLWGPTRIGKHLQINLHLSRGCSRRCRFCSNHLTQGRRFRTAPLEQLEKAMEDIKAAFEMTGEEPLFFNLEDDNLLLDPAYMIDALGMIKEFYPRAKFKAENGIDYRLLSEDILSSLFELGFTQFNVSLVQTNNQLLNEQHRGIRKDRFQTLLENAEQSEIRCISYFIAGLPGDSKENLIDQLLYLAELPTEIGISLFYPVPGLPGFEDLNLFLNHPPALCAGSSAWPWAGSLTTGEMVTGFRLARMINFLKRSPKNPREAEMRKQLLRSQRLLTWQKGSAEGFIPPGTDEDLSSSLWDRTGAAFCL